MNTNQIISRLLKTPPIQWEETITKLCKKLHPSEAGDLARAMDSGAGTLAYLAEYLSVRSGATGCGEHPHSSAAKHAKRRAIKVNRALGFTYPDGRVPNL